MIIPLYKPKGPTSHDIVDAVRRITGEKKVGHAGTLDPLASGVLVLGITRKGTRLLGNLTQKDKEYKATIILGATSTTHDREGCIEKTTIKRHPSQKEVEETLLSFIGSIEQVPPRHSAVKVDGVPAHRRVRRGEDVELEPRRVDIHSIELLEYRYPVLCIRVETGPGVYIRSLAHDIGESLETGAYLGDLERTRVGQYYKKDALSLDEFKERWHNSQI